MPGAAAGCAGRARWAGPPASRAAPPPPAAAAGSPRSASRSTASGTRTPAPSASASSCSTSDISLGQWRIYRVCRICHGIPCDRAMRGMRIAPRALGTAVARTSRFTCLPHGHLRLDRRDISHAGSAHKRILPFFFEEKRILPIGRTRGVPTIVAAVLYLYIVARLININIT
jgi:hypothetical protein